VIELFSMLEEWNDLFNALLFGQGAWLGLIIILVICIVAIGAWKYSACLFIPVAIFLGIAYLSYDLGWHALIMFFASCFFSAYLIKDAKER